MNEQPGTYFFQYVELVQDLRYSTFEQFQIPPKTYYVWEWLRVICSRSIIIIQRFPIILTRNLCIKKEA
jgi:hypothetical protein